MENVRYVLKELGFTNREAKIYLLLLKEGDLPAFSIARGTEIDRTTIYDLLENMISKGVVSTYTKNKAKQFRALNPEKLLLHYKEKYSSLETILPDLNKINKSKDEKVTCELFAGLNGLKIVLKELFKKNMQYKVIGIRKEYEKILGYFNDLGTLKADELNIKEMAIVEEGTEFIKLKAGKYRYLNSNLLPPVTTLIFENIVVFLLWKEPFYAIRIENLDITKTQEKYFDILWKIAKK